jgi:hypothetical protein
MKITETLRGAMRRIAGVSLASDTATTKRKTAGLPSILNTYGPRADAFPKATPMNLRRFSETPVARKAINTIKDRIAAGQGVDSHQSGIYRRGHLAPGQGGVSGNMDRITVRHF